MTEPVTVTQADRDAAEKEADGIFLANSNVLCRRDHEIITVNLTQAFAAHRTDHAPSQHNELAAIERARECAVIALRARNMPSPSIEADDIERGTRDEHSAVQSALLALRQSSQDTVRRDAVIEECAKICEACADHDDETWAYENAAGAIRALTTKDAK